MQFAEILSRGYQVLVVYLNVAAGNGNVTGTVADYSVSLRGHTNHLRIPNPRRALSSQRDR